METKELNGRNGIKEYNKVSKCVVSMTRDREVKQLIRDKAGMKSLIDASAVLIER